MNESRYNNYRDRPGGLPYFGDSQPFASVNEGSQGGALLIEADKVMKEQVRARLEQVAKEPDFHLVGTDEQKKNLESGLEKLRKYRERVPLPTEEQLLKEAQE